MRFILSIILACLPSFAAITNQRVTDETPTGAVVRFVAPDPICTLKVSQLADLSEIVYDLDGSLFTGANSDAANSSVIKNGNERSWAVGKTLTATAGSGVNYSRALQAHTLHYYEITCGVSTATGTFTTRNIPLGNTHVDNQTVDGTTGRWLQSTLSFTSRAQKVIDPITGVALYRTMMSGDFVFDAGTLHTVTAGSGAAWTNPNNIAGPPDTTYATYSGTAQAKLAATMYTGVSTLQTLDFVTIKITGFGNGATTAVRTIQICLSVDGTTCVSSTTDLILPTSVGDVYYNQSLQIGDFMGWTDQLNLTVAAGMKLLIWKKATSGSDTISLDNAQVGWGQSEWADPTSAGFNDICGRTDANGWENCIIAHTLFYVNTVTAEVRFGGKFFVNNGTLALTIPNWNDQSVSSCGGDNSQPWDQTNPNLYYCSGLLNNHKPGIVRFTTDSTHAAATPNTDFAYSNPVLLTPIGSDLDTLIQAFEPTVIPYFTCAVTNRQGNYLMIGCIAGDQDTWAYLAVFDLGNGTAMNDASCGSITAGRCSLSGVGIVAVNQTYNLDIARGCTIHTFRSNGDTANLGWEIGGLTQTGAYGKYPTASALTANMDSTQTDVHVTSTWVAGAVSKSGTISSDAGYYNGYHGRVYGSGATFFTSTTVGDTITAAGQSRVVVSISDQDDLEVDTAFSPDLPAGTTWTSTWPAQPAGYATGEPVGPRFPRWINGARVNDFYTIGTEMVRVVAKPSSSVWTVERGCNRDISLPYVPCTGTGAAHLSGAAVTLSPNAPQDVLNSGSPAHYWNFLLDPHASDTNYADWSNGNHGVILAAFPWGFGGAHNTSRGNASGTMISMADYVSMASNATGGMANMPLMVLPPNYNFQEHSAKFGGKSPAGGFGNDYQRHPSNQHYNYGAGYFQDFFTDAPQFVNAGPLASATLVEGNLYKVVVFNYLTSSFAVPPAGLDRKYFPTLCLSGKFPLLDISSPTSHIINSATAYTCCYAEADGECRGMGDMGGASSAGDFYMNAPGLTSTGCTGSEVWNGVNDLCAGNQLAFGNGSIQYGVRNGSPTTIVSSENHKRSRTLVRFGAGPRSLTNFSNAKTVEGGLGMFTPASSNAYNQILFAKVPPMPSLDSIPRDNFSFVQVKVNSPAGVDNVIIKFGYDANFYCTSRAEACIAAASNAPYFFASATYSGVSCATSCTIQIPFFPAKLGYYQVIYRDAANATVSSGTVQLVAAP